MEENEVEAGAPLFERALELGASGATDSEILKELRLEGADDPAFLERATSWGERLLAEDRAGDPDVVRTLTLFSAALEQLGENGPLHAS